MGANGPKQRNGSTCTNIKGDANHEDEAGAGNTLASRLAHSGDDACKSPIFQKTFPKTSTDKCDDAEQTNDVPPNNNLITTVDSPVADPAADKYVSMIFNEIGSVRDDCVYGALGNYSLYCASNDNVGKVLKTFKPKFVDKQGGVSLARGDLVSVCVIDIPINGLDADACVPKCLQTDTDMFI